MNERKLTLSPNKKLSGLCAGIGDYFNIDPSIIRLIAVGIAFFTAIIPALIVYLIISLIVPAPGDDYYYTHPVTYRPLLRSNQEKFLAGVCGGIARTYNKDTAVIRLLWALTFLLIGYGLILYIAAAIIIPASTDYNF